MSCLSGLPFFTSYFLYVHVASALCTCTCISINRTLIHVSELLRDARKIAFKKATPYPPTYMYMYTKFEKLGQGFIQTRGPWNFSPPSKLENLYSLCVCMCCKLMNDTAAVPHKLLPPAHPKILYEILQVIFRPSSQYLQ